MCIMGAPPEPQELYLPNPGPLGPRPTTLAGMPLFAHVSQNNDRMPVMLCNKMTKGTVYDKVTFCSRLDQAPFRLVKLQEQTHWSLTLTPFLVGMNPAENKFFRIEVHES